MTINNYSDMKNVKHLNHLAPPNFINGPPILIQKKNKTITLNKDYLCDLFHYIHLKHLNYFDDRDNKDVPIQLSSTMLQKKYGKHYSFYIQYLLDVPYIRLIRKHTKCSHCSTYKFLYWKVKLKELMKYENRNKKMIENYKDLLSSNHNASIYPKRLLNSIHSNLKSVTIEKEEAIKYLNLEYPDQNNYKYSRNYISIVNIDDKNPYLISDAHGRIHTNFTVLKKEIRNQFLRIDGEKIKEKDISNSQALFFLYLLSQNLNNKIGQPELLKFQNDVINGVLYDNLATYSGKTRADIKPQFFKYLFGSKRTSFKEFNESYPSISKFIKSYKTKLGDYKLLSHELQLFEGDFIFNGICKKLTKQKIKYFTVHDSINVKQSHFIALVTIFESKLNDLKQEISKNIQDYYS